LFRGTGEWQLGNLDQAPVPPLIRQVVEGRLGGLGQQTRHLLEVAAVIGQVVPFNLWQAVSNADDDMLLSAIEQAIDLHLIEPQFDGTAVHFHHALIRDALYDRILPPRLMAWHRDVAEILVQSSHPDPDAVAHHFRRSGDPRAFEWLLRAGLRAWNAAAWLTAAERFRTAAAMLAGNEDRMLDRGWLLFATGYLLRFSRDSRTIDHLDEAERLAVSTNDQALAAYVLYHRGTSRCIRGDALQGLPELERGVVALEEVSRHVQVPDTDFKIRSMIQAMYSPEEALPEASQGRRSTPVVTQRGPLVNWLAMAGRYAEALEIGESFRNETVAAFGDDIMNIRTCLSGRMGLAHTYTALGRPLEASDEYATASRGLARLGDHLTSHLALWFELISMLYLYRADNLDERARIVKAANRAWDHAGEQVWTSSSSSHCQLLADLVEGRWQNLSHISVDDGTIGGVHEQGVRYVMGTVARHRGDTALAWEQIRAAFADGPRSDPAGHAWFPVVFLMQSLAVELALDAGDLKLAEEWVTAFDRSVDWSGALVWTTRSHFLKAQYHRLSGDFSLARQHAERALSSAQDRGQTLERLHAYQLLGRLDLDTGQTDAAERHIAEALALADACAAPFERGHSLILLAEAHASTGNTYDGLAALDEARAICSLLDAWPALERIEQVAARFETTPQATSDQLSLSPRELEVLSLIAEGKTDREIAADLFISHHTVMSHVSHILNKLGVDSRAAAAAQAIRRNLI
ncbi:MAG TPA: LuxR C-terminal-related transcriptional regulator, partial [Thermomicrobiales bacterium]|nr:LuxR C-terminal-related transcriptional regulator [Thermomicrobiales bacterium]